MIRSRQPQPVHLWHGEETHTIDEKVVLPKRGVGVHGRGGIRDDFQDVIAPHGPGKVEYLGATVGVVDFLAVGEDEAFAGCEGPYEGDVVFFAAACGSCFSGCEGVLVCESESPVVMGAAGEEGVCRNGME